ncbi:N-acetylglucosaminyl-phosphatidylinositol de-N-acetylase [Myripristis murdjan]|uniref:N-acetylglucosaminylphosphatidylinositol deacetylase n=1 Tax=Myripristis murdjan TaxID=586833 RepID=A0A668A969_9TELE|nr:N-acetylglucosaminyl-phosphatidylinositol de-N-acetylase [Myripristis murdjan]
MFTASISYEVVISDEHEMGCRYLVSHGTFSVQSSCLRTDCLSQRSKTMTFLLVVLTVLLCFVWIKCIYHRHRRGFAQSLKHLWKSSSNKAAAKTNDVDVRAVIVTAHPDDECMFFSPAVLRLVELNACVHLLCLSQGNYYNQGAQRKEELLNSCAVLGIPASRVTVVDHKNLPDNPNAEWSISLVSSLILRHIRAHSCNMVLTFDGRGVSGHANHIAIHKAVSHLASTGQVPDDCCLLSLVTVGLLRKYLSFLELPLSWLLPSSLLCIIGSDGYRRAKEAMRCHRTQLLWFRYLYIFFSRYMLVNTFQEIPQGPKNLKIY